MAEIPVEKKSNLTWLWILLALILLALLIWWAVGADDDEAELVEPVAVEETIVVDEEPVTPAVGEVTLAAILANPEQYIGTEFSGDVSVGGPLSEMTDRGFWVENNGQRMFALINDGPLEEPMDINPGQQLRISSGTVMSAASIGDLPGDELDADTRRIAEEQQVFLLVNEDDMEITQRP
ncbi:MAG: hypothetical protein KKE77_03130 [Alphaproteobacteria bacterium]|nr:hypothetical protein [Alphaproteobacteria bacterium]